MLTVATVLQAYSSPIEYSVWIVPGSTDDFENTSACYIDDYLAEKGVLIRKELTNDEVENFTEQIESKWTAAGQKVTCVDFVND